MVKALYRAAWIASVWTMLAAAHAQTAPSTQPEAPPPPEAKPERPPRPDFEGAIGMLLNYRPAFSGSSDFKLKPELAGFLRYKRFTVTGAGGFTTRRDDEVERGLDVELLRQDRVRMNLSFRFDAGRKESASDQLRGMGDIRPTVRARLGVRWRPAPLWELAASSSFDALNRVGGYVVNAGVSRTFPIDTRQHVNLGVSISGAGDRYMQAWYGVTPEQSAASGYPEYRPREGLRDLAAGVTWRIEINPQWAAFAGGSISRQLAGAADSPLTRQANGWQLTSGIARRF